MAGNVACKEEMRNTFYNLDVKSKGNGQFWRIEGTWDYIIERDLEYVRIWDRFICLRIRTRSGYLRKHETPSDSIGLKGSKFLTR